MGFSLFSSFRDPDQFCNRPPLKIPFQDIFGAVRPPFKSFQDIFGNVPSAPKNLSRILFGTFCPPLKSFQAILDKFLDNHFPFSLQHESLIKLNVHLPECVCGHKSGLTSFIRPTDSDCGFCLSGIVFK